MKRIENQIETLRTFTPEHEGSEVGDGKAISSESVLEARGPPPTRHRGLNPVPFLVPAVLDAIRGNNYATVTQIVPGEADQYCSQAARDSQATTVILSNDSDFFVHDLGAKGAFAFVGDVDLTSTSETVNDADHEQGAASSAEVCSVLKLSVYLVKQIGIKLGVSMQRLAFEWVHFGKRPLSSVIKAAKEKSEGPAFKIYQREFTIDPKVLEADTFMPAALDRISQCHNMDPRVSELVYQLATRKDTAFVYLAPLIEDPSRSSAWQVSTSQRAFAYSVCTYMNDLPGQPHVMVFECTRRGERIAVQDCPRLDRRKLMAYANGLNTRIRTLSRSFGECPNDSIFWRLYALVEAYRWHLLSNKTPPSSAAISEVMTGKLNTPLPTWNQIHLFAQVDAFLYTMRMIQQILSYTLSTSRKSDCKELIDLSNSLKSLPPLAQLLPSRFNLARQTADKNIQKIVGYSCTSFARRICQH